MARATSSDTEHVCFDRVLPRDLFSPQALAPPRGGRVRAIAPIGKTWMNGSVLHERFLGGTPAQRALVREQAVWWTEVANLQFVFDDSPRRRSGSRSTPPTAPGPTWAPTAAAFPRPSPR
jgi:hypothetical protein